MIAKDPMLADPANGSIGNLKAFGLLKGSPCIDAGVAVGNGGSRDFFGNNLPDNGPTCIGAHESVGTAATP